MLTTSSTEKDIRESYKNQANCYIVKPVDVNDYMNTIEEVKDFWTKTATIPIN
jgi:DNA-binding NarL/FixJ family response regulator